MTNTPQRFAFRTAPLGGPRIVVIAAGEARAETPAGAPRGAVRLAAVTGGRWSEVLGLKGGHVTMRSRALVLEGPGAGRLRLRQGVFPAKDGGESDEGGRFLAAASALLGAAAAASPGLEIRIGMSMPGRIAVGLFGVAGLAAALAALIGGLGALIGGAFGEGVVFLLCALAIAIAGASMLVLSEPFRRQKRIGAAALSAELAARAG